MVKWQGRRQSDNVEDRRGAVSGAGMPAAGLIVPILRFVIGKFGVGGIVVLIGGFFALQAIGLNPLALLAPTGPQTAAPQSRAKQSGICLCQCHVGRNRGCLEKEVCRSRQPVCRPEHGCVHKFGSKRVWRRNIRCGAVLLSSGQKGLLGHQLF